MPKYLLLVFLVFGQLIQAEEKWPAIEPSSKSVYEISHFTDGAIIIGASLATMIPYLTSSRLITQRCPCDFNEVNSFDRPAIGNDSATARALSDVLTATAVVAPLALDWLDVGWGPTLVEDVVVFAEVLAVNSALVTIVKHAVQRPIPLAYSGRLADSDEGYRSFYSGHASTAFAAVTAASMTAYLRYHPGAAPWLAGLALGTTVGVSRVLGGNHFNTDVMVGGIVGTGVGLLIPWLHARKGQAEKIVVAPQADSGFQILFLKYF